MRLTKTFFMLPLALMLLISLAASTPDEAIGRVSKVVDGDPPETLTWLANWPAQQSLLH
jgi:P pilus assembly chaperone PapD